MTTLAAGPATIMSFATLEADATGPTSHKVLPVVRFLAIGTVTGSIDDFVLCCRQPECSGLKVL